MNIFFSYGLNTSEVKFNLKHYELQKNIIEEKKQIINYILDGISMLWSIEYEIIEKKIFHLFNGPNNILMKNEDIHELNEKIINQYNKIIFYKNLKKIYEQSLLELNNDLEELNKINNVVNLYSLKVSIEFKREQVKGILNDINHTLKNLSQEYDKTLLLNPSPFENEYFIIPMRNFNMKKIAFYINNSFRILNQKNKINNIYHNPIHGLQSQLVYNPEKNKWSISLSYILSNFKESLEWALNLEKELIIINTLWKKIYYNIHCRYKLILINKLQIKNIKNHIKLIEKQINLLEVTNDKIKYLSKIYKLKQQLIDLKINLLKIEEARINNIWYIFLNIAPINYCKIIYYVEYKI